MIVFFFVVFVGTAALSLAELLLIKAWFWFLETRGKGKK